MPHHMPQDFPTELNLAMACARWPFDETARQEINRQAASVRDWQLFLAWVSRHGIDPLAYRNLCEASSSVVPDLVLDRLRIHQTDNAQNALLQIAEAARITRLLADAGIPSIVIKGPVLAQLAFGDPTLRASRDIDILVAPGHVKNADKLIIQAGYRRFAPDMELTLRQYEAYQQFRCQFGYYSEQLSVILELHWRLVSNTALLPLDGEALWGRVDRVRLGGFDFRTLPDKEMFLYLCVHGSTHVWFRLKWLADVAALLHRTPPGFTDEVADRANSLGVGRSFHQALVLAYSLMGAPVPPQVMAMASADKSVPGLVAAAHRALNWDCSPSEPGDTRWFNMWIGLQAYRLRPRLAYWWTEFRDQLCSPEDWARLPLPSWLWFLYPPFRPLSWVMRKLQQALTR